MVKVQKMDPLDMIQIVESSGIKDTKRIVDSIGMAYAYLGQHERVSCSVSGGADSDIMMDMLWRLDKDRKVKYYFINTGLEYRATRDHILYLQDKYDIPIETVYPKKSIPVACREHGQPFLTKLIAEAIYSLYIASFDWSGDRTFEEDLAMWPKNRWSIKWWHNKRSTPLNNYGNLRIRHSIYIIDAMPFLKDFLIQNPPTEFKISSLCCNYAKKDPAKRYVKENRCTMDCIGSRKADGGARSAFNSCYHESNVTAKGKGYAKFHPLFWYINDDKAAYEQIFDVKHSACYTVYGLKRTGCAGCPFAYRKKNEELLLLQRYEPDLWRAVHATFKEAYEYTQRYIDFAEKAAVDSVWRQLLEYDREYEVKV